MKKIFLLFLGFFVSNPSFAVEVVMSPFRINYLVYYQILYKLKGVPVTEFKNVNVIKDTASKLVFEYAGKEYTATLFNGQGSIYVTMPDNENPRYITQARFPAVILSSFDKK